MLSRAQVQLLLSQGKQLTEDVEGHLRRRDELQRELDEAFSLDEVDRVAALRGEIQRVEERTADARRHMRELWGSLRQHVAGCLAEHAREIGGVPRENPLSLDEPRRIQEFGRYSTLIDEVVQDASRELEQHRRRALQPRLTALSAALSQLRDEFQAELPAVSAYLAEEAYLDLPLLEAEQRIEQEHLLVEHELAEKAELRARREQEQRLAAARQALASITTADAGELAALIERAAGVLGDGAADEWAKFWQEVPAALSSRGCPEPACEALVAPVLAYILAPLPDADDPTGTLTALAQAPAGPFRRVDTRLAADPRWPAQLDAWRGAESRTLTDALRMLKRLLPASTRELAEAMGRPTVAGWLLAEPREGEAHRLALYNLATRFEGAARWADASALWSGLPDAQVRATTARLIALAETTELVPADAETWHDIVWNEVAMTRDATAVAAVASVVVALRHGLDLRDLVDSLVSQMPGQPQLARALKVHAAALPGNAGPELHELARRRSARDDLARQLVERLETPRSPAGGLWRELYRDKLLPAVRDLFRTRGAAALAALDIRATLRDLERKEGKQINPAAEEQISKHLQEFREGARALADAEARLRADAARLDADQIAEMLRGERPGAQASAAELWAYDATLRLLDPLPPPSTTPRRFHKDDVVAQLYDENPLVALARVTPVGPALCDAVLSELAHDHENAGWRLRCVAELERFDAAERYLRVLSEPESSELSRLIDEVWQRAHEEVAELLDIARQYRDSLDRRQDSLADVDEELAAAERSLGNRDVAGVRVALERATKHCDRIDRLQTERRHAAADVLSRAVAQGVRQLLLRPAIDGLAELLVQSIRRAPAELPDAVTRRAAVIDRLAQGLPLDEPAAQLIEVARAEAHLPSAMATPTVVEPPQPQPVERRPAELSRLPKLVQVDLESLAHSGARGETPASARSATVEQYRQERARADGRWEAPLLALLEERANEAWAAHNFSRAAEYFRGAAYVAYCGAARIDGGTDAARRDALRYAGARLARLRVSAGESSAQIGPPPQVSARAWVQLIRSLMLMQGYTYLTEILETLTSSVPDLLLEILELPVGELPHLRESLLRALVDGMDRANPAQRQLLELLLCWDLDAEHVRQTRGCLAALHEAFELRSGTGRHGPPAIDVDTSGLPEVVAEPLQRAVKKLRSSGTSLLRAAEPEVNITAVTGLVYLSALERHRTLPVHLRIAVAPGSPELRNVTLYLKCQHNVLDIAPEHRSLDIAGSLSEQEPVEITCLLQARSDGPVRDCGEALRIEVTHVAVREGGVARAINYKGRALTLDVRRDYPYAFRPNPYSPGKAVASLELIKGRDEETQEILRNLRGAFQDNVPLIWGARRIGKSTLLYRFKLDPEVRRHYEPVLCDMEGLIRRDDTTNRFLARLADRIRRHLAGTKSGRVPFGEIKTAPDPLDVFQRYLDELVESCGERSLLLMFDEMELFFEILHEHQRREGPKRYDTCIHEDIVRMLRHNMQHTPRFSVIMAGTRRLYEIIGQSGERLFQMPVAIELRELGERDAAKLVTEPIGDTFEYSTLAKDRLLWLSSRHPYLIQALCHEVYSYMQDARLSVCSLQELERVIEERVLAQTSYFEFQVQPLRRDLDRRLVAHAVALLTQDERRADIGAIVGKLALHGSPLTDEQVEACLRALIDEGILTQWRGTHYRFRLPIVGTYVAKRMAGGLELDA